MWSRVPDYLTEKLQEVEEEIEGEQQAEMEEEGAIPDVWESARERIDEFKEILHDLIDGKTHWLEADRDYGLLRLRGEIHEWYLDYQEELAQIIIARRFTADLNNVTERLKLLRTIVLVGKPPVQVRVFLEESARCFLYGLFRSATALSRAALESALQHRLPASTLSAQRFENDVLRRVIDAAAELGLISVDARDSAHRIRRAGNDAIHGRVSTKDTAERTLLSVRQVVELLYGVAPGSRSE